MEFSHKPVLLTECIENLNIRPDGIYVDGTLGGGGHSAAICERLSEAGTLIGIDRDEDALEAAGKRLAGFPCRKILVKSNYVDIKQVLAEQGIGAIDGALLDLGVSSFQLDNAERGFSYMQEAPLDMRMDREDGLTAYEVVNEYPRRRLTEIISGYGEERWASRIASFIEKAREEAPIETTTELVDVIKAAVPASARREGPHPAKRTFQAIRIEVNDELGGLERALRDFVDVLAPGGRFCVISFHSLEDRLVKEEFARRENPCTCPKNIPVCVCGKKPEVKRISKKPIVSAPEELEDNPRARSAKLRVCEKL
ncbi:MAG: 16S rRNA (cytosine(1402)-N(4))-methyltransferase RsmH [Eubacterium sp.]|nr:16S rRNA (cytosine(1402)-N(4))-methyltransferase RsmH [Eubacterium sp.]